MNENSETVNLIISISFFIYFLYFVKASEIRIDSLWVLAMFCIILSNIFTIVEGYFWEQWFDFLEHASYTLASLLFFSGAIRLKTY